VINFEFRDQLAVFQWEIPWELVNTPFDLHSAIMTAKKPVSHNVG